jgi:hypothetical protein
MLAPTSTKAKFDIAAAALAVRQEQVAATVRYYGAEQETNAELDKITAQVVAELQALRLAAEDARSSTVPDAEIDLIQNLREALERLFSPQRKNFIERKVRDIQRRISQLFFDSELYAELAAEAGELKAAAWPEQALYFALKRHEATLLGELEALAVEEPSVRARARDRLRAFTKQLCAEFLSRTTPELEALLGLYREVLTQFFVADFSQDLGEMAWAVIKESRVAHGHALGYRLEASRFAAFRAAYDKHFIERLVLYAQGPLVGRAPKLVALERQGAILRFVNDPRIHSAICEVVNDAVYDHLHGEGFLDLPVDWRHKLARS